MDKNQRKVTLKGFLICTAIALTLFCSSVVTHAGGPAPGTVLVEVKFHRISTDVYCGTYTQECTIKDDGKLYTPSDSAVLNKCTQYYSDCCPEGDCKFHWKYTQGLNVWEDSYPE